MPRYYNKTRSPLPLALPVSGSMVVPAKSFVEIAVGEEGCAAVVRNVKKGFLVRPILRPDPVVLAAPVVVVPVVVAPTPEVKLPEIVAASEAATDEQEDDSAPEADADESKVSKKKGTRR